jgi:hypothetical protein
VLTTIIASANPHQQLLAVTVSGNKSEPNGRALIAVATAPQSASPESEYGRDKFPTPRLASALAAPHGRLLGEATRERIDHLHGEYEHIRIAAATVLSAMRRRL